MRTKTIEQLKRNISPVLNNGDDILLKEFNLLLYKNLNTSRSVKYYADQLAISTKKLNNITKKYLDKTAKEYIEITIISESKRLLIKTSDSVKQISYSMGFTEPTNFNKFFKKFTTVTPLQFREEINKGAF